MLGTAFPKDSLAPQAEYQWELTIRLIPLWCKGATLRFFTNSVAPGGGVDIPFRATFRYAKGSVIPACAFLHAPGGAIEEETLVPAPWVCCCLECIACHLDDLRYTM